MDKKVLIVDDSMVSRRFIKIYLKKMGITNIIETSNVKSALKKLKKEDVDLILSDWSMQGMTGLKFLQTIRGDKNLKHIPFIMVTAEGLKENIAKALDAGVTKYIVKPYTYEDLKSEIESAFHDE